MEKIAIVFAGQGSQFVGMGQDFYNAYDYAKEIFEQSSKIVGYDVAEICFAPNTLINQTIYTQPAIVTTSLAIYSALIRETDITPFATLGFSLGEYSALCAAGVFDIPTTLSLVDQRAKLMHEASTNTPGAMAAVLGIEREVLEMLCRQELEIVQVANYNSPAQYVIGGTVNGVNNVAEKARACGAKRVIMLNVSGAFHTAIMQEAADKMYEVLTKTKYKSPKIPIVMNCNAKFLEVEKLAKLMQTQIQSSVYFEDSIRLLIESGVTKFIEIGPGSVLSGLIRKIDSSVKVVAVNKVEDIKNIIGEK